MRIEYLADHPELARVLADWHHAEWHALYADWSLEKACSELQSHTGRRQVPTTVVALEADRLVGSASLLSTDLDRWDHLSPWLASLYVIPTCRGRGIGEKLVTRVVEEARGLGLPILYLWTAGQQGYYARLGWELMKRVHHRKSEVAIMRRVIG